MKMRLLIILATLLSGSLSYAGACLGDCPAEFEQQLQAEKSVQECSFNPDRYRMVSFVQDFVLHNGQGDDYVEFKKEQSYHVSGMRIERTEYPNGDVYEQEYVVLAVPGHSARPMTVKILDTMSSLRVKAWKALECR